MAFSPPLLTALCALLLLGCAKKPEAELQSTFKAAPDSKQKNLADEAMAAFERKDYPKAVANLQNLRTDSTLNPDQLTAVQDMMAKVQTELAIRADKGDRDAQATLRLLQAMPRR